MAKILLVDDNLELLELHQVFLEQQDHQVTVAPNGLKATQLLKEAAFDIMVTDILMPDKEGIETIMEVCEQYPQMPVIAVSGGGRTNADDYLNMAERLGAARSLSKPFAPSELQRAIEQCLQS